MDRSSFKCRMPDIVRFAIALIFSLAASPAHAEGGAAPAMFGVKEVLVQFARFGSDKTAANCGLLADDLAGTLNTALAGGGVPAVPEAEAKPPEMGVARINLTPDIFTFNSEGLDCTSWVSLTAQSRNSVRIPPIETARNVNIVYWREGIMVASSQTAHEHVVEGVLQKLAKHFARQYKLDQPPAPPNQ